MNDGTLLQGLNHFCNFALGLALGTEVVYKIYVLRFCFHFGLPAMPTDEAINRYRYTHRSHGSTPPMPSVGDWPSLIVHGSTPGVQPERSDHAGGV